MKNDFTPTFQFYYYNYAKLRKQNSFPKHNLASLNSNKYTDLFTKPENTCLMKKHPYPFA